MKSFDERIATAGIVAAPDPRIPSRAPPPVISVVPPAIPKPPAARDPPPTAARLALVRAAPDNPATDSPARNIASSGANI